MAEELGQDATIYGLFGVLLRCDDRVSTSSHGAGIVQAAPIDSLTSSVGVLEHKWAPH